MLEPGFEFVSKNCVHDIFQLLKSDKNSLVGTRKGPLALPGFCPAFAWVVVARAPKGPKHHFCPEKLFPPQTPPLSVTCFKLQLAKIHSPSTSPEGPLALPGQLQPGAEKGQKHHFPQRPEKWFFPKPSDSFLDGESKNTVKIWDKTEQNWDF